MPSQIAVVHSCSCSTPCHWDSAGTSVLRCEPKPPKHARRPWLLPAGALQQCSTLLQAHSLAKAITLTRAARTLWAKPQALAARYSLCHYCANRRTSALRVGSCCGAALSLLKAKSTEGTSCAARRLVAAARRGFLSGPISSNVQPGSLRHCVSHSKIAAVGSPVQQSTAQDCSSSGHNGSHTHRPSQ